MAKLDKIKDSLTVAEIIIVIVFMIIDKAKEYRNERKKTRLKT